MNNLIYPCFWHNGTAKEAAQLYIKAFGEGNITADSDVVVMWELFGQKFMGLNGGPEFSMNPSISMFVVCKNEDEVQKIWDVLIDGGKALMECSTYPWAKKYGWLQDKFGLSWQISFSEYHKFQQRITPLFMFTQDKAGKAKDAMQFYTTVFPDSSMGMMAHYEQGEGDKTEYLKHAQFVLRENNFMAMDSSGPHEFTFNEGISLVIDCDGQEEVDYYWEKLTAGGEESQCGWLKDTFGVSWQVTPRQLMEHLGNPDKEKAEYAWQAMLTMHKIVIAQLKP